MKQVKPSLIRLLTQQLQLFIRQQAQAAQLLTSRFLRWLGAQNILSVLQLWMRTVMRPQQKPSMLPQRQSPTSLQSQLPKHTCFGMVMTVVLKMASISMIGEVAQALLRPSTKRTASLLVTSSGLVASSPRLMQAE